ncbi:MAG: hypothetical protein ACQKBU_05460, partial [Verrucomicrobiales bacterium]
GWFFSVSRWQAKNTSVFWDESDGISEEIGCSLVIVYHNNRTDRDRFQQISCYFDNSENQGRRPNSLRI